MTYPAEHSMKRDPVISPSCRKVYDYLTTMLDFTQVRHVKEESNAPLCGVDRKTFSGAVGTLIDRGYLVEHERGLYNVRRLTLAWSIEVAAPTS